MAFDSQGAGSLAAGIGNGLGALFGGIGAVIEASNQNGGGSNPAPAPAPVAPPAPAPAASSSMMGPLVLGALFLGGILLMRK